MSGHVGLCVSLQKSRFRDMGRYVGPAERSDSRGGNDLPSAGLDFVPYP